MRRGIPVTADRLDARTAIYSRELAAVPPGCGIRTICDNPKCVEPSHLAVVPLADNLSLSPAGAACGERSPKAKLTTAQVRELRSLRGKLSQRKLVIKFRLLEMRLCSRA